MPEPTEAVKKVVDAEATAGTNGSDGTVDHSTTDDKGHSVPLATFLEMKKNAKQLEDELKAMKAQQKANEEAKLVEDGKLKEVITAKEQELSATRTELEKAKQEAEESKQFKAEKVKEYKSKLGDKWNEEYAGLSLAALDKLVTTMVTTKEIKVDKGATGEHAEIELTVEQKKTAEAMYPYTSKENAYEYYKHNLIKSGKIKPKEK